MIRTALLAAAVAVSTVAAPAFAAGPFDAAIAGPWRSAANKARDQYRHPAETLAFFGIKPGQTVVEVSPGGGWYTEILAPALKGKGKYVAGLANPAASENAAKSVEAFKTKFGDKAIYGDIGIGVFAKGVPDIVAPGSADVVLTFRNVHNWHMGGWDQEAFNAFFKALKPGGTLGVVEHRMPEDRPDADMKKLGYMKPSYVKALAAKAGFKLAAESEVNANPKDTKDYPDGVWTLPPTYQLKDVDRAKYAAIGESDRMTLKFVKPR
ncbi:class I SAM-dependent methyltransferase [Sandarakinorhabdus rubra]|uniref:class I SAM-dependent methyltransferase n=1 Tax=Sandarakinorhabdus rubra TaxID=2672568 RepID=UPI0013D8F95D|nr:class I SAM-dependent methyltransferase [Sandarakinorhabdus rubra]